MPSLFPVLLARPENIFPAYSIRFLFFSVVRKIVEKHGGLLPQSFLKKRDPFLCYTFTKLLFPKFQFWMDIRQ